LPLTVVVALVGDQLLHGPGKRTRTPSLLGTVLVHTPSLLGTVLVHTPSLLGTVLVHTPSLLGTVLVQASWFFGL
jgi:hypothetical protein